MKMAIKSVQRKKRQQRARIKITGTSERPRMSVFRSLTSVYVQIINDEDGKTLVGLSSNSKCFDKVKRNGIDSAKLVGAKIASICLEKNITKVVFDKGGYKFHGRVKALAESARSSGLIF